MRRNKVRHFIHAILDLLPLFVIPIFAININQKSVEPIQVEVQEKISVDFNQKLNINVNERTQSGVTFSCVNNVLNVNGDAEGIYYEEFYYQMPTNFLYANNIYYIKLISHNHNETDLYKSVYFVVASPYRQSNQSMMFTCTENSYIFFRIGINNVTYDHATFSFNIFNLTQMFGEGNEPTEQEFNIMFPNETYAYTESQKMLVNKPTTTTYDKTDIGSQFLYSLYIPVHDYFNFNNLFNMGAIYDWIQLNLFSGVAPLPVFIIWNIIVYEFFVDLIFLLYSVFMFIIDFATSMIDRFMYKSRKGI